MIKKILLFVLIIGLATVVLAQKPNWINFEQRQQLYPQKEYFVGFAMNNKGRQDSQLMLLEKLSMSSTDELVSTVQVTIESISTQLNTEINDEFSQSFKHASTSFSKINLAGLKTETYYDKRKKMGYALSYVKKEVLIDYYLETLKFLKSNIAGKIKLAEKYIIIDDEESALKTYYECMPLFREAESAYTIVILLRASKEEIRQINEFEAQVKAGIASVYRSDQVSLSELCSFLSYGFKIQTGIFNDLIRMGSFTYQDTKMSSPFSRRFIKAFEKELIEEANFNISSTAVKPGNQQPEYVLSGTYWEDGENLKVIAILRNIVNGKPLASAEGYIPIKWLKQRDISFKPENFGQAAENMQLFKANEITDGGMQLDLWTNKGNDSPIFEENDTLKLYIRTNNECYVRIVDHMADGSKILLVDNMYIGSDKVNMVVKIPIMFQCAPPFGTEIIQANTQTIAFSPLHIKSESGYDFILDDLGKILINTRGFKRISNEDLKAEKRIVVSTMKME